MWDSFIKNFGIITTVLTLMGSAVAFFVQRADDIDQQRIQAEASARASKKVFLDKQAELYFAATTVVSRIATRDAETIDPKDVERFFQLYWGELAMVEDFDVERAMVRFRKSLIALQQKGANDECAQKRTEISLMLAHCIRESLGKSWSVKLGGLSENRCTASKFQEIGQVCP